MINKGFIVSPPFGNSKLKVYTLSKTNSKLLIFLEPFTLGSGILFIVVGVGVAILVWAFEEKNWKRQFK